MDISAGLIAKGALGAGALAAAGGAGYKYSDKLGEFFSSLWSKEHETINKKLESLGITEASCKFTESDSFKSCDLNSDALKKVAFTNKGNNDNAVTTLDSGKKVSLKVEKGYESGDFPLGLRFTFKSSNDNNVEIGGDSNKITLKKDIRNDFKITTDGNKLESAWTLSTLAAKVGVTCTDSNTTQCDFVTSKINVWKSGDDYVTGASVESGKKITVAKESTDYNGGFKLTVSEEITLNGGTSKKSSNGINKLTNTNMSYEIDVKDKDGKKVWFLVEKSTSAGG